MAADRDRYFDTLRAVAIIRVVLYHAFPFAALELVFPSMGVMFALGGSLMVKSLDRNAGRAVRNRLRRLLPALWAMAAVLIPLMLHYGPADRPDWWRFAFWILPVAQPPTSDWDYGYAAAGVLWYLVTYLWLVLLSPLLLKLYRRWNVPTVLLPLVGLVLFMTHPDAARRNRGHGGPERARVRVLLDPRDGAPGGRSREGPAADRDRARGAVHRRRARPGESPTRWRAASI